MKNRQFDFLINKILPVFTFVLLSVNAKAQSGMEEFFYESGKIKVVVAVVSVVLAGIIVYVLMLDRRLKKIERRK